MNGSPFSLLENVPTIVLAAGHGGNDPGATNGPHKERDQAIPIVDRMAELLRSWEVDVVVTPHAHDTHQTIPHINDRYGFGDAWVIEVHRDSASGLSTDDASRRCGCYYGDSQGSRLIGEFVRESMKGHGAHSNTWARRHTESRHGSLGWIQQTRPLAHLLELGFMQGLNSTAHLMFLAEIGAKALFETFTGREANDVAGTENLLLASELREPSSSLFESAARNGDLDSGSHKQLKEVLNAASTLESAIRVMLRQQKREPEFREHLHGTVEEGDGLCECATYAEPDAISESFAHRAASTRAELADQIINHPNISLARRHPSGVVDDAFAYNNIVDTAAGNRAIRSNYGNAPGGSVYLDERLLRGLLSLANDYSYHISEIAGASHSVGSRHYVGVAADITYINGSHVDASHKDQRAVRNRARAIGAQKVLGPGVRGHDRHIHIAWTRP